MNRKKGCWNCKHFAQGELASFCDLDKDYRYHTDGCKKQEDGTHESRIKYMESVKMTETLGHKKPIWQRIRINTGEEKI